ncbi:J domain-containing protein [Dickeya oryzae]|uniref:J domain-containing protein n=1 Tax=Dickeya oryzae TaxID=1240404 RepID=A0AB39I7Q6_9GAMM|nr:J domain-containing protein [Dickeya oryzae]MCA6996883.1 J domain-containing protein [Dickeya oryzae]
MSIWQTLGIPPTRDEAEIRRAYARRLKIYRPDSDPAGYQQLREAFDAAKQQASEETTHFKNEATLESEWSVPETSVSAIQNDEHEEALIEVETLYREQDILALAHQLVHTEMLGIVAMARLWKTVSDKGNLLQQQQFHQHLASALAEVPELTEGLLDRVASQLGWGMNDYDFSHIIPIHIQHALRAQLRQTEVNRAWKQVEVEEKQGSFLDATAIRLLKSDRHKVPFWVHLVPGMITILSRHANNLIRFYPELASRLNPVVLQFLQKTQVALSWQGIFLLVFWGGVFNAVLPISGVGTTVSIISITTVVFYLYISDGIMLALKSNSSLCKGFLCAEFVFSSIVLLLFFGGLLFASITSMPASGHGAKALIGMLAIMMLFGLLFLAWPKYVPFIRKPGIAMSNIFSSPWKMMEWLNFAWFSWVWIVIYFTVCVAVIAELLKLFV